MLRIVWPITHFFPLLLLLFGHLTLTCHCEALIQIVYPSGKYFKYINQPKIGFAECIYVKAASNILLSERNVNIRNLQMPHQNELACAVYFGSNRSIIIMRRAHSSSTHTLRTECLVCGTCHLFARCVYPPIPPPRACSTPSQRFVGKYSNGSKSNRTQLIL